MRTQSSRSTFPVIGTAALLVAALGLGACSSETNEPTPTGQTSVAEATATPRAEARMTLATEPAAPASAPAEEVAAPAPEVAVAAAAVPPPTNPIPPAAPVLTLRESVDVALKEAEPRLGELQTEAEELGDKVRANVKPQLERLEAQIKALNERRSDWGSQSEEAWKQAHMELTSTLRMVEYEVYHSKLDAGLIPPPEVPGGVKDRARDGQSEGTGVQEPAPRTAPRRERAPAE